jgi:ribosomal protein S3
VHPTGFRLGVVKGWQSRWYAERDYKDLLAEDFMLRKTIQKELANAAISRIEIERAAANQVSVTIHTAKPGIVIGKSGEKVDRLRTMLEAKTKKRVRLNIVEIRQPELDAYLVGRSVAEQLEKRVSFRRYEASSTKVVRGTPKASKLSVVAASVSKSLVRERGRGQDTLAPCAQISIMVWQKHTPLASRHQSVDL